MEVAVPSVLSYEPSWGSAPTTTAANLQPTFVEKYDEL